MSFWSVVPLSTAFDSEARSYKEEEENKSKYGYEVRDFSYQSRFKRSGCPIFHPRYSFPIFFFFFLLLPRASITHTKRDVPRKRKKKLTMCSVERQSYTESRLECEQNRGPSPQRENLAVWTNFPTINISERNIFFYWYYVFFFCFFLRKKYKPLPNFWKTRNTTNRRTAKCRCWDGEISWDPNFENPFRQRCSCSREFSDMLRSRLLNPEDKKKKRMDATGFVEQIEKAAEHDLKIQSR